MKKHFLLLSFLLWTSATFAQQSKVVAVNSSEQALNKGIVALKPADIFRKPELALQVWIDKPVPLSMYDDKEKKFQEYLNEKAEDIIKTYSPIGDESFFSNDNLKLPVDQRSIDNEPITPYTWKWLDLEKDENGEKVVAKLRRPNWWILANKADKIGNIVYLELAEQGITGGFTVKKIRVSQIDTRLMKPKREGDYTYRPLTGWFQHETSNVWDYTFNNGETIGATPNHPFFSERRQDYIPIGEIEIGESIRNPQNDLITLASKSQRTNGTEKVYNLEIYRDHNFLVGKSELLVHNACWTAKFDAFVERWKNDVNYKNLFESANTIVSYISDTDLANLIAIKARNGIGNLKNIANVDYNIKIGGQTKSGNHWAISGFTNDNNLPNLLKPRGLPPPSDATSIFKSSTFSFGNLQRGNDSEVKILDKIASELGATSITQRFPNATGKVKIVTELFPCGSCAKIINQFKEMFPNVELEIIAQNKNSFQ